MEEGKISVIVPIYKVENYLNRCVESIRKQTYRNLEIILVDDGSPDACGEMCDRYAQEDSRIRVIHKEKMCIRDRKYIFSALVLACFWRRQLYSSEIYSIFIMY